MISIWDLHFCWGVLWFHRSEEGMKSGALCIHWHTAVVKHINNPFEEKVKTPSASSFIYDSASTVMGFCINESSRCSIHFLFVERLKDHHLFLSLFIEMICRDHVILTEVTKHSHPPAQVHSFVLPPAVFCHYIWFWLKRSSKLWKYFHLSNNLSWCDWQPKGMTGFKT